MFIHPTENARISQDFGASFVFYKSHNGTDYGAIDKGVDGDDIYAIGSGTVTAIRNHGDTGYGYHVYVKHDNRYTSLYAHLSNVHVLNGQKVYQGQVIGEMGNTGKSTATHLHLGLKSPILKIWVDPQKYIKTTRMDMLERLERLEEYVGGLVKKDEMAVLRSEDGQLFIVNKESKMKYRLSPEDAANRSMAILAGGGIISKSDLKQYKNAKTLAEVS